MDIVRKDVVVIGLGAFGSAALWRLAHRGVDVAGIERHGIAHDQGSSHGATRLFRVACMEHPVLSTVALKSLELWTTLGAEIGETLVSQTGCLNTGAPGSRPVTGALASGVPVTALSHEELLARQPQYAGLAPDDIAVWDPSAGICYPERNIRAHIAAAQRLGADVYPNTEVLRIEDGVVRTADVEFRAGQVIIATGAGLKGFVPKLPLAHRPTPVNWFKPKDPASTAFALENFPAFIWDHPNGAGLWGHGSTADHAVKIGVHPEDEFDLEEVVAQAFPELEPKPVEQKPCHVTDSPDGQFLVGRLTDQVLVAGGDSGHGFKHCAGIGELLAQMAADEPTYCPTDFLDPNRFP